MLKNSRNSYIFSQIVKLISTFFHICHYFCSVCNDWNTWFRRDFMMCTMYFLSGWYDRNSRFTALSTQYIPVKPIVNSTNINLFTTERARMTVQSSWLNLFLFIYLFRAVHSSQNFEPMYEIPSTPHGFTMTWNLYVASRAVLECVIWFSF